jgi:hypothetical protein
VHIPEAYRPVALSDGHRAAVVVGLSARLALLVSDRAHPAVRRARQSWEAAYERSASSAYRSALAILGDPDAAAAVVEQAFVEVSRSPQRGQTVETLGDAVEAGTHRLAIEARIASGGGSNGRGPE